MTSFLILWGPRWSWPCAPFLWGAKLSNQTWLSIICMHHAPDSVWRSGKHIPRSPPAGWSLWDNWTLLFDRSAVLGSNIATLQPAHSEITIDDHNQALDFMLVSLSLSLSLSPTYTHSYTFVYTKLMELPNSLLYRYPMTSLILLLIKNHHFIALFPQTTRPILVALHWWQSLNGLELL